MERLISKFQIDSNLRRTASKGYISLLNEEQLENLALKYFGITNELGNIVGYMCPYSGEILTSSKDVVLEHIIPISTKGGTVLFNCIPTSSKVNGISEKGSKHLITWWITSKYWDDYAPKRFEKLVNYILEAYEKVFEEYSISEVESSYLTINLLDDENFQEEDDLEIDEREESQKQKEQAKDNGIHSYLGFILDCIKVLEQCEIDTEEIRNKLRELENKHIFDDIERYEMFQSVVQDVIKSTIGDDNQSYLTYSLRVNIKKLMDSITYSSKLDIYKEIKTRLTYIEKILKQNSISLLDYYKNLMDLDEINILYSDINNITEKEINEFIETIKIGHETKIIIFIEMLNKGNAEILKYNNTEVFEGYENILVGRFWQRHKDKIIQTLFEELKNNPRYDTARQTVLSYLKVSSIEEYYKQLQEQKSFKDSLSEKEQEFLNNINLRIDVFIEMLNEGNTEILNQNNTEVFEGYENILVGRFWQSHKDKIIQILFEKLKNNSRYDTARQTVLSYLKVSSIEEYYKQLQERKSFKSSLSEEEQEFQKNNNINLRIDAFIEMLNKGNTEILKANNLKVFEGYENISVGRFWYLNKDRIIQKLFNELKNNPGYDTARQTVLLYLKVSSIEEYYKQSLSEEEQEFQKNNNISLRIDAFIEMLNKGNTRILKAKSAEVFEGYENIPVGSFWIKHREKIKEKLFGELKDDSKYDCVRQLIKDYEFQNDLSLKIDVFIEMLNKGNSKILKTQNSERFEGYENIPVGSFWHKNKEKIKEKLFGELKDDSKYDPARQLIKNFKFENDLSLKINMFIEMLNKGNTEILKFNNEERFEGYENIPVGSFWNKHKEKIKEKLFEELKNNPRYETARQTVLSHFKVPSIEEYYKQSLSEKDQEFQKNNNINLRIDVFIEMLNKGNSEILKTQNSERFEGYENFVVGSFWQRHKEKIIQKLFEELENDSRYETARQTVLSYFRVSSIEEYYKQSLSEKEQEFQKNNNINLRIDVFIEMLNKGNAEILKYNNTEVFEGYENIPVGRFWETNKEKIIQKLFKELENDSRYNIARQTVLLYLKVSSIEEYEIKLRKGKTLKQLKQLKSDLENIEQSYLSDEQQIKSNLGNVEQFHSNDEQQSIRRAS